MAVAVSALVLGVVALVLAYCVRQKICVVEEYENSDVVDVIWIVGVVMSMFSGILWLPVRAVAFSRELVLAVYYGVATLVTLVAGLKLNERVIRYCGLYVLEYRFIMFF